MTEPADGRRGKPCPDASSLQELTSGRLPPTVAAKIRLHIDGCPGCQTAVAQLLLGSEGMPSSTRADDWEGRLVDERYDVDAPLGAGASAVVYAAFDRRLERRVALKVMRARRAADAEPLRQRLLAESKVMASLRHPNIVTVFDVFDVDGHVVVVMELVEGQTLRQWLQKREHGIEETCALLGQAGLGLAHAHRHEWVHRDFKPENVLIGEDGRVLVADFGLAKLQITAATVDDSAATRALPDDDALRTIAVVGTPAYMAPEQWAGEAVGAGADVFSFGVTLYESACGRRPFEGTTATALQNAKSNQRFVRPGSPEVPGRIARVLERALHPNPAERPTMETFLAALEPTRSAARRVWVGLAGVITVGAVVALWPADPSNEACTEVTSAQLWDEGARGRAEGLWKDDGGWERLDAALERYAEDWQSAWSDVCTPSDSSEAPSSDVRRVCLREQLVWVGSTVELLLDEQVRPQFAMDAIPSVSVCANPGVFPVRRTGGDARKAQELRELRAEVYSLWALDVERDCEVVLERAPALIARAEVVDDPWVLAELHLVVGESAFVLGRLGEARSALLRSAELASQSGHVGAAAKAWLRLAAVTADDDGDPVAASEYAAFAEGAIDGLGGAPTVGLQRALLADVRSVIARTNRDYAAAEQYSLRAIELARPFGPIEFASMKEGLAVVYASTGRNAEAIEIHRELVELFSKRGDPDLVDLYSNQLNLGGELFAAGEYEEALKYTRAALSSAQRVAGGESGSSVNARANLIQILISSEALDQAEHEVEVLQRVLSELEEPLPRGRALAFSFAIQLAYEHERWATCVELGQSALRLPDYEMSTGAGLTTSTLLGACLLEIDRPEAALDVARSLLAELARAETPAAYGALAEQSLGLALLGLSRTHDAVEAFTRAEALVHDSADEFGVLPVVRVDLARAQWDSGEKRASRRTALLASQGLVEKPDADAEEVLRVWAKERAVDLDPEFLRSKE